MQERCQEAATALTRVVVEYVNYQCRKGYDIAKLSCLASDPQATPALKHIINTEMTAHQHAQACLFFLELSFHIRQLLSKPGFPKAQHVADLHDAFKLFYDTHSALLKSTAPTNVNVGEYAFNLHSLQHATGSLMISSITSLGYAVHLDQLLDQHLIVPFPAKFFLPLLELGSKIYEWEEYAKRQNKTIKKERLQLEENKMRIAAQEASIQSLQAELENAKEQKISVVSDDNPDEDEPPFARTKSPSSSPSALFFSDVYNSAHNDPRVTTEGSTLSVSGSTEKK